MSSSCSNMLRLSQELLQLRARALHAHLQSRYTVARQFRDLLVLELLDMLEEKGLAILGCQPLHRVRMRRASQSLGVVHEQPAAARRPCSGGATAVDQNPIEPCAEPRGIVASLQ